MKIFRPALFALVLCLQTAAYSQVYVVNNIADTIIGGCTTGHCTLREAIIAANGDNGPSEIRFNFPTAGPTYLIKVLTPLPALSGNLVIDALAGNSYQVGNVIIDGLNTSGFTSGLRIGSNTAIYGLRIQRFPAYGIIGTESKVTIGAPDRGNILVQNDSAGIFLFGMPDSLKIQGNFIGTTPAFAGGFGNGSYGIVMSIFDDSLGGGPQHNFGADFFQAGLAIEIGGIATGQGNVICSNGKAGIKLNGYGDFGIRGNFIGTDTPGTATNLGNGNGIEISGHVVGTTTIGGTGNASNTIAHNAGQGVAVTAGSKNVLISRNRIYCNDSAGIQLGAFTNNSVTQLADSNFTFLNPGQISGTANNGDIIEVFKNDTTGCEGAPCQGKTFLGSVSVFNSQWSIQPSPPLSSGDEITVTRTVAGNTSAFSDCQKVCFDPFSVLSGGGSICPGDSINLFLSSSGQGPLTIFYTANSVTQPPLTNVPPTSIVWKVSPSQTTVYQLVAVSDGACSGSVAGSATVTVHPSVSGSLLGGGGICEGEPAALQFSLSGTPPFSVGWQAGPVTMSLHPVEDGQTLNVFPSQNTNYVLLDVTDANGCSAMVNDTAFVTISQPPVVNSVDIICEDETYDVEISVAGSPQLFANGLPVMGNQVVYSGFPAGSSFGVLISNACGDTLVVSEDNCFSCLKEAGAFQNGNIEICEGDTAIAQHSGAVLQAGDVLVFVLTTSLPPAPGNLVAVFMVPEIAFSEGLDFDTPYFMSALVGKNSGSGMVDWSDPCLATASGGTAIFHEKPEDPYWLQGEDTLCGGETLHLEAGYYEGADFEYLWLLPSGDTVLTGVPKLEAANVGTLDTGRYYVLVRRGGCFSNALGYHHLEVFHASANQSQAQADFSVCGLPQAVTISATPSPSDCTGRWVPLGGAVLADAGSPETEVTDLKPGSNLFIWQVICPGCGMVLMDTLEVLWEKPPVAVNDTFVLQKASEAITMNVLKNDQLDQFDGYGQIEVTLLKEAEQDSVRWLPNNHSFVYEEPSGTFRGEVHFQYVICRKESNCPNACDTADVLIHVLNLPQVPGGITPNGDQKNDNLNIAGLSDDIRVEIVIANRWGSVVFKENDYDNEVNAWKGDYHGNGKTLPPGAYFYQMRVHVLEQVYEESGVVHLIEKG